jgi:lactate dehydrogenase-like 2-hydroxyacid dehydrogenase
VIRPFTVPSALKLVITVRVGSDHVDEPAAVAAALVFG